MTPREGLQQAVFAICAPHVDHTGIACDGERGRFDCCWQCSCLDTMDRTILEYELAHDDEPQLTVPAWLRRRIQELKMAAL